MNYWNSVEKIGREERRTADPYDVGRQFFREQMALKNERAFYTLAELLILKNLNQEELNEIHKAKLTFPGQRIIQEGPETPLGQAASIKLMTRWNVK